MSYETELRNKNRGYMNLVVWQKAIDLFELAWKLAYHEASVDFKLRSQFVDSAQSISANIAEGYGRRSVKEYLQFLYTSTGSLAEALTRAVGLLKVQLISESRFQDFNRLHYEVENRRLRLIEKLEQKRDDGDWMTRIAEDPEEYSSAPSLEYSITPSAEAPILQHSNTPTLHYSAPSGASDYA